MNRTIEIRESAGVLEVAFGGVAFVRHSRECPFAFAGRGHEKVSMYRGNFEIEDTVEERIPLVDVEWAERSGRVHARFSRGDDSLDAVFFEEDGRLVVGFSGDGDGRNRFWFRVPASPEELVYGCGEQFSKLSLRGSRVPLWTGEQGVGRNKSTYITFQADANDRAGGDWWWTFFPQPTFVSSAGYFVHSDSTSYAAFDFREAGYHELEFWQLPRKIYFSPKGSMLEVVSDVSALLGRQRPLPEWVDSGVVLGIQGGTETCDAKLRSAIGAGVRVAGVWAQDWEGRRITSFGKRLMWNWQWDRELYPNLDRMIETWNDKGTRFLGYVNPYLAEGKPLFVEAEGQGYLARDASGGTYLVDFGEFDAGIVDLTDRSAFDWFKGVIRREMIDLGLSGWMADFGEYLPVDAVLSDGRPAMLAHNEWPALWARLNREAVDESGRGDDIVYFMRAGYSGSQRWCPLMWAGDQNVDWSEDDGLPSVVPAALSLAVCGHGLHHSDIGGYTTLYGMRRDKELFCRWAELAAFTAMMRTHEGNRPDDNWQFDGDDETLARLAVMSAIFSALSPYRRAAMEENWERGIPLMRPLFLHYPDEPPSWNLKDEFLFGRDVLVAPVVTQGAVSREVWLPSDRWLDAWSGNRVQCGLAEVEAPIGRPPAFVRAESPWAARLVAVFSEVASGSAERHG